MKRRPIASEDSEPAWRVDHLQQSQSSETRITISSVRWTPKLTTDKYSSDRPTTSTNIDEFLYINLHYGFVDKPVDLTVQFTEEMNASSTRNNFVERQLIRCNLINADQWLST